MKEYPFSNINSNLTLEQIFMELEAYKNTTNDKIMRLETTVQQLQDELIKAQLRIQELASLQNNQIDSKRDSLEEMFSLEEQQERDRIRELI